ncbi:hypothetical protein [Paenibacillus chitinolyticus]|uniref:hypothetical protein n=1 Tax=Paenibacillus chitinolyticus TaxID=79263 RepID=UPI00295EA405|nr:hypothetical protein [Paenibacillus chitinolyticus]
MTKKDDRAINSTKEVNAMCRNGTCRGAFNGGEGTGCGRHCADLRTEANSNEGTDGTKAKPVSRPANQVEKQPENRMPSRTETQPQHRERSDEQKQEKRDRLPADHLPSRYFLRTKYFKYWDFWDHFR